MYKFTQLKGMHYYYYYYIDPLLNESPTGLEETAAGINSAHHGGGCMRLCNRRLGFLMCDKTTTTTLNRFVQGCKRVFTQYLPAWTVRHKHKHSAHFSLKVMEDDWSFSLYPSRFGVTVGDLWTNVYFQTTSFGEMFEFISLCTSSNLEEVGVN